jgi:hypothetical protein
VIRRRAGRKVFGSFRTGHPKVIRFKIAFFAPPGSLCPFFVKKEFRAGDIEQMPNEVISNPT